MDNTGKWIKEKRGNGRFLFPRRAMEKIYKGYFLGHLRKYITNKSLVFTSKEELENILDIVGQKKWNVYAKAPFGGPLSHRVPGAIAPFSHSFSHSLHWLGHSSSSIRSVATRLSAGSTCV